MSSPKQIVKFYSRYVTSSGFLLTEKLHKLFIKYIKEGRRYVPESKELEDLIPTFQNGAKTNRKSLQNKFKSWSKRMDVRKDDDALILKQSGKPKVIVPQEQHAKLIMFIHLSTNSSYSEGSTLPINARHKTVDEIVEEIKKEYTWTRKNFGLDWDIVASVVASKCGNKACLQKLRSRFEPRSPQLVKQANLLLLPPKSRNVNPCLRTNKAPPYSQRTTTLETPSNCPQLSFGFYLPNKKLVFEDQSVSTVSSSVKPEGCDHWSPIHATGTCTRLTTKSLTSVLQQNNIQQHPSHKQATAPYAQMSNKSIPTSSKNMSHYTIQPQVKLLNSPTCSEPTHRQISQEGQKDSMINSLLELPSFLQTSIGLPQSLSLQTKTEVPTTTAQTVVYLIDPSCVISASRTFKVTLPMSISSSTSSSQVSVVSLINSVQPISPSVSKEVSTQSTFGSVKQHITKSSILDTSLPTVLEPTLISPYMSISSQELIKCTSCEENSSSMAQSSKTLVTTNSTISENVISSTLSDNYFYRIQNGFVDNLPSSSSNNFSSKNYRTGEVTNSIFSMKLPISSSHTSSFSTKFSSHKTCTVNAQVPYSQSHVIPIVKRSDPSQEHSYYFSGEVLKSTCSMVPFKNETISTRYPTEQPIKEKRKKKSYSGSKCKRSKTVSFANEDNISTKEKRRNNFKDTLPAQNSSFSNRTNGRECSGAIHHEFKVTRKKKKKRQSNKRNSRKKKKNRQKDRSENVEGIYSKLLQKIQIIGRCLRPAIAESEGNLNLNRLLKDIESSLTLVSILKSRSRFNKEGAKL